VPGVADGGGRLHRAEVGEVRVIDEIERHAEGRRDERDAGHDRIV
jgi:hypothetical protein